MAGVPILPVGFDFKTKQVVLGELLYPGTDEEADFKRSCFLFRFYRKTPGERSPAPAGSGGEKGKTPHQPVCIFRKKISLSYSAVNPFYASYSIPVPGITGKHSCIRYGSFRHIQKRYGSSFFHFSFLRYIFYCGAFHPAGDRLYVCRILCDRKLGSFTGHHRGLQVSSALV